MEEQHILALFTARSEEALSACQRLYGRYLFAIARRITGSSRDAEECMNDALLRAWNAIPPHSPENMASYLGRIVRNLALNRVEQQQTQKRGGRLGRLVMELEECLPGGPSPEDALDRSLLTEALNGFLASLPSSKRILFVRRYWYGESIAGIALSTCRTPGAVAMTLSRLRKECKVYLSERSIEP